MLQQGFLIQLQDSFENRTATQQKGNGSSYIEPITHMAPNHIKSRQELQVSIHTRAHKITENLTLTWLWTHVLSRLETLPRSTPYPLFQYRCKYYSYEIYWQTQIWSSNQFTIFSVFFRLTDSTYQSTATIDDDQVNLEILDPGPEVSNTKENNTNKYDKTKHKWVYFIA